MKRTDFSVGLSKGASTVALFLFLLAASAVPAQAQTAPSNLTFRVFTPRELV
jgi:hypothetical protein